MANKRLAAVMAGLRERGLIDIDGRFADAGRETPQRIEAVTGDLALRADELEELSAALEPITAKLVAAGSR